MAHYAFLDNSNIVTEVITGKNESDGDGNWETYYGNIRGKVCKRTSYNTQNNTHLEGGTPFRGNFAGIHYTYDESNDVFIPPKPYDSWTLDTSIWSWVAPVDIPTNGVWDVTHTWNETTKAWDLIE
tara:strand:+ start:65 stop:442 length:378 start_codon:yes stop_codon:yes gene_type:complete